MLLERTVAQLDIGFVPAHQAEKMGHLGYMQWLGALRAQASYTGEAKRAHARAAPLRQTSPAIDVFCRLLEASIQTPLRSLDLKLPVPHRRGGARARREAQDR